MGGWAEGLACADPGARTPISVSGNYQTDDSIVAAEKAKTDDMRIDDEICNDEDYESAPIETSYIQIGKLLRYKLKTTLPTEKMWLQELLSVVVAVVREGAVRSIIPCSTYETKTVSSHLVAKNWTIICSGLQSTTGLWASLSKTKQNQDKKEIFKFEFGWKSIIKFRI